jgi:hypothetical protein
MFSLARVFMGTPYYCHRFGSAEKRHFTLQVAGRLFRLACARVTVSVTACLVFQKFDATTKYFLTPVDWYREVQEQHSELFLETGGGLIGSI